MVVQLTSDPSLTLDTPYFVYYIRPNNNSDWYRTVQIVLICRYMGPMTVFLWNPSPSWTVDGCCYYYFSLAEAEEAEVVVASPPPCNSILVAYQQCPKNQEDLGVVVFSANGILGLVGRLTWCCFVLQNERQVQNRMKLKQFLSPGFVSTTTCTESFEEFQRNEVVTMLARCVVMKMSGRQHFFPSLLSSHSELKEAPTMLT